MKKESKIRSMENGVHISIDVLFPLTTTTAQQIQPEALRADSKAFALDVLSKYAGYLETVLKARMDACINNLFNHRDDVVYNDGNQIVYKRKDDSMHSFNVPSYIQMEDCVFALQTGRFSDVLNNKCWCDQLLKAICNDRETPKEDKGKIKFSDLISILCECHAMADPDIWD